MFRTKQKLLRLQEQIDVLKSEVQALKGELFHYAISQGLALRSDRRPYCVAHCATKKALDQSIKRHVEDGWVVERKWQSNGKYHVHYVRGNH